jgi:hypothetical protein
MNKEVILKEFDGLYQPLDAEQIGQKSWTREWLSSALDRYALSLHDGWTQEKHDLIEALAMMYDQYCADGHDFMTAGEYASGLLDRMGYMNSDDVGRGAIDYKKIESLLTQPPTQT